MCRGMLAFLTPLLLSVLTEGKLGKRKKNQTVTPILAHFTSRAMGVPLRLRDRILFKIWRFYK